MDSQIEVSLSMPQMQEVAAVHGSNADAELPSDRQHPESDEGKEALSHTDVTDSTEADRG